MQIKIRSIPHAGQRYATTGDWRYIASLHDPVMLEVSVSDMGDWRFNALVGIHEAIEALMCKQAGVTGESVDRFDMLYERAREKGMDAPCGCTPTETSEPGDDVHAPYYQQHKAATIVEEFLAEKLQVDWKTYEQANLALYKEATP